MGEISTIEIIQLRYNKFVGIMDEKVASGVNELKDMDITLQEDPSTDMSLLQKNIATAQGHMSAISRLVIGARKMEGILNLLMSEVCDIMVDKRNEALLKVDIQKLRPKVAQEAKLAEMLQPEICLLRKMKQQSGRLVTYLKVVEEERSFFRKTMTALAMQVGVLKGQVAIGEHRLRGDEGKQLI